MAVDATDLGALEKALNDAAGKASVLWTTFVTFELYLAIAFGSVTHRDLFLETPVKLPILNVDLPLVAFFVVAPAVFVIFHFYVFLQINGLAAKTRTYNDLLLRQAPTDSDRQRVRQRLDSFLVLQFLAGPKEQRGGFNGLSLRLIAWITLAGAPVLIILQAQVIFLPYHHEGVTWAQRLLLLIDLVVIWFFWNPIRSQDAPILGRVLTPIWKAVGLTLTFGLFLLSALIATFPGERADEHRRRVLSDVPSWTALHNHLFADAVDEVSGQPRSIFSNRLVLTDQNFVELEKLDKVEVSRSFRGRNFRSAILNRADLRKADFTGAMLDNASLTGAKLGQARFGCAPEITHAPRLPTWPENGCTWLQKALLVGAELQGASLVEARLQGANFFNAQLQNASLKWAKLRGANLYGAKLHRASLYGAELQGATLIKAQLQGASLEGADLGGAKLTQVQLQGADLQIADLQGAELHLADLQGANLSKTNLEWSSLTYAGLQGAVIDKAYLLGASLDGASVWRTRGRADFALTTFERLDCVGTPWEQERDSKLTFQDWLSKVLSKLPGEMLGAEARQRLSVLDPAHLDKSSLPIWSENCPSRQSPDLSQFIDKFIAVACSPDGAPYVARGLIENFRFQVIGAQFQSVADRMRKGKTDLAACPGVAGFTNEDWAMLDRVASWTNKEMQRAPSGR